MCQCTGTTASLRSLQENCLMMGVACTPKIRMSFTTVAKSVQTADIAVFYLSATKGCMTQTMVTTVPHPSVNKALFVKFLDGLSCVCLCALLAPNSETRHTIHTADEIWRIMNW